MKQYLLLILLFTTSILCAQQVFEYNLETNVLFRVYQKDEGMFYKISKSKEFKQNTPEQVAASSFFAYSNELASKLYLDQSKYTPVEEANFNLIKKTKSKDAYIQILHKMSYTFQSNKMAYIMFIAKVKLMIYLFGSLRYYL